MQVIRHALVLCALAPANAVADEAITRSSDDASSDLDLKLTLSSFLFRQTGDDAPPIDDGGATVESASPVRRYFGDLRVQLDGGGLAFDGRVRQTSSERYQSGATGGGEYEIRTLAYRLGTANTQIIAGRQYIDDVGATKVDGVALVQRLAKTWSGTLFAGGYPALGSRSLDTDYPAITRADGTEGAPLIPITGGLGVGYNTPDIHGGVGLAALYVAQDVPDAPSSETSRVFATANGYARPAAWLDIYHFALADVAGGGAPRLTNGSLGVNVHPTTTVQVTTSINHVSTDLFQIAARNTLVDPDPDAIGVVQNDVSIIRISQDVARAGTSVALAHARFELSMSGGYHRRPGVEVTAVDGSTVAFPEAKYADATIAVLDRRSLAGLRVSASGSITHPLDGDSAHPTSRATIVRVAAGRAFHDDRAQIDADVTVARFRGKGGMGCQDSLDVFSCFSAAKTLAAQAGALASYRVAREWQLLLDAHLGAQDVRTTTLMGAIDVPRILSLTVFARAQWRYR